MKPHPKGAAIMIFDSRRRLLLLKRSPESIWMPDKWGLPGGRVETGEHPADAAKRETQEETKLQVREMRLLSMNEKVAIYSSNDYVGTVEIDFEHTDWAWVSRDELTTYDLIPEIKNLYDLGVQDATR